MSDHVVGRRRFVGRTLLSITAFLLLATACGSSKSSSSNTTAAAGAGTTSGAAGASKSRRIGIVNFDRTAITANAAAEGTKAAAEAKGWQVSMIDSGGDVDKANSLMQQFATQKMDAIVIIVYESSQLGAGLAAAADAKVPIFSLGGSTDDRFITNADAALPAPVIDAALTKIGTQPVDMLAMTYTPGYPCRTRTTYLQDQVKSKPNISLTVQEVTIPGQLQDGERIADAYLKSHPAGGKPIYMIPCFTDPAIGATTALASTGRKDVTIYTWDFTQQAVQALRDKQLAGVLYIDVKSGGEQTVKHMEDHFAGNKPEKVFAVPNQLVTPDDIESFLKSHPGAGD
jgi:ribose transport system substrate-binding protein